MARVKVPVSLRVVPEVRDVGMARAAAETRSFASYIEVSLSAMPATMASNRCLSRGCVSER